MTEPKEETTTFSFKPAEQVATSSRKVSSQLSHQSAPQNQNTGEQEEDEETYNFRAQEMAEYDEKQPSPTGFYGWLGFGCSVFALACLCVSFASPYWMQTYPMSFNTFRNMGLWELCMHDYMHHKDDSQDIYNGCWWVFDRDEKYWKLREWILPRKSYYSPVKTKKCSVIHWFKLFSLHLTAWFITVQVLVTMSLLCSLACVGMTAMIFFHFCPLMNHEYHQSYAMFAGSGLCFFNSKLLSCIAFGTRCLCKNFH